MFGIFKKMREQSARINDYFANAVRAWILEGDEVARFAALNAAMTAAAKQRSSMTLYLSALIVDAMADDPDSRVPWVLKDLMDEIELQDWSLAENMAKRNKLAKLDDEYATALDQADDQVFVRRYPALFDDPHNPTG